MRRAAAALLALAVLGGCGGNSKPQAERAASSEKAITAAASEHLGVDAKIRGLQESGKGATAVVGAAGAEGPISFRRNGEKWKVDRVSTTFLRSVLRARVESGEEPPLENPRAARCFLRRVSRMRGDRLNDLALGQLRRTPKAQEAFGDLAGICAAEAGTDLGTTQDVIAESGADVDCALKRLRTSLTAKERVEAARSSGALSDSTAAAVRQAIDACR